MAHPVNIENLRGFGILSSTRKPDRVCSRDVPAPEPVGITIWGHSESTFAAGGRGVLDFSEYLRLEKTTDRGKDHC